MGRKGRRICKDSLYIRVYVGGCPDIAKKGIRAPIAEVFDDVIRYPRPSQLCRGTRTQRMGTHAVRVKGKQSREGFHLFIEGSMRQQRCSRWREEKGTLGPDGCRVCIAP
jgi:hypothetical protein